MALASLRFQRNAQDYEESRQGMTVFAGDAASFHEWQLRLQIKKSLCKAEELLALTAKVVDALRGEALSCAMEIGLAKLCQDSEAVIKMIIKRRNPQMCCVPAITRSIRIDCLKACIWIQAFPCVLSVPINRPRTP